MGRALCRPGAAEVACDCDKFILGYKTRPVPLPVQRADAAFLPERQTNHIWRATRGRLLCFSDSSLGSLPLSSHPERGSGEVGVVGQMGQLCDHSVCLCGRERFIALITDPTTQWASENPTSQPAAASEGKDGQRNTDNTRTFHCSSADLNTWMICCNTEPENKH